MKSSNVPPNGESANSGGPQLVRKKPAMARVRIRPMVNMLPDNKRRLYRDFRRGVPEKDLAPMYDLRREEVELVIWEMIVRQEEAA